MGPKIIMNVVIIGSGNVGTVLGRKIQSAGHTILQVMSRHLEHAQALGRILRCEATDQWTDINPNGDVYLLALTDSALLEVREFLQLGNAFTVHTAGSVPMEILLEVSHNYGVLYPLQSLRMGMEVIPELPLLIEANSADGLSFLSDFANTLSPMVRRSNDVERMKLHLAAVVTGNFSNHLFSLAQDYCDREGLDFSLLLPLIRETTDRMQFYSPAAVQTGPAIRNDHLTLDKHLEMLDQYPALKELYRAFTESIRDFHNRPE